MKRRLFRYSKRRIAMRRIAIPLLFLAAGCAKPIVAVETPPPIPEAGAMVNKFAFDFFAKLRKTETGKNIFVSPYSISTALGMTATGARGNTFEQMKKVLHLPDDATADAYYANLAAVLKGGKGYELSTANAVWAQEKYRWEEPFKQRLAGYGVDAFREVDFRDKVGCAKLINIWVEERTKQRIKDLILPEDLRGPTLMVLVNAIYFKGEWAKKFDTKRTREGDFTNADGTKSKVSFMTGEVACERSRTEDAAILALPYAGNELQMVFVLPHRADGLPIVESKCTQANWDDWMKDLYADPAAEVNIPKFKLETKYKLNETLATQGMPDAFSDDKADFSGMTRQEALHIDPVIHKAFIEINEDGTEAAAATAVIMKGRAAKQPFLINRPFLFAIRHPPSRHGGDSVSGAG
jgi:serpin B